VNHKIECVHTMLAWRLQSWCVNHDCNVKCLVQGYLLLIPSSRHFSKQWMNLLWFYLKCCCHLPKSIVSQPIIRNYDLRYKKYYHNTKIKVMEKPQLLLLLWVLTPKSIYYGSWAPYCDLNRAYISPLDKLSSLYQIESGC